MPPRPQQPRQQQQRQPVGSATSWPPSRPGCRRRSATQGPPPIAPAAKAAAAAAPPSPPPSRRPILRCDALPSSPPSSSLASPPPAPPPVPPLLDAMPPVATPLGARAAAVAEERLRRWALAEAAAWPPQSPPDVHTFELAVSGTSSPLAVSCCVLVQQQAAGDDDDDPKQQRAPPVLGVSFALSEDALADNGEPPDTLVLRWGAAARPSAPLLATLSSSDDDDEYGDDEQGNGGAPPRLHAPRAFSCPLDPAVHSWGAGGGAIETTFGAVFPPPCNVGTESGKSARGGGPPLGVPASNAGARVHALLLRFPLTGSGGNAALCKGGLAFVLKTATRVWLSYDGLDAAAGVRGGHFFVPTAAFAQLAGVEAWGAAEEEELLIEDNGEKDDGEVKEGERGAVSSSSPAAAEAPASPASAAAAAARAAAAASPSPDPADAVAAAASAAIAAFVSASSGSGGSSGSGSSGSSSGGEEEEAPSVSAGRAPTTAPTAAPEPAPAQPAAASAGPPPPPSLPPMPAARTARVLEALAARPADPPLVASLVRGSAPPSRLAGGGSSSVSPEGAPVPPCDWAVARIATEEPGAERSLMHRFRAAERLLADAERERGSDGPRAALAVAAWLRFSAARHLVWNKNYNVKPREIAAAQEQLTQRLLRWHALHPWLRAALLGVALPAVGRGGGSRDDGDQGGLGQRVRDEILAVQHAHPRCRGGIWEQWHQKLHNNTSADDVAICRALIAYVEVEEGNGPAARVAAYWRSLAEQGVTRERLASFDRAITHEPALAPEQRRTGDTDATLADDLRAYLKTLVAVHGGGDLSSAAAAVLGFELPKPSGGKARAIRVPPVPGFGEGEAGRRLKAAIDAVLAAQAALGPSAAFSADAAAAASLAGPRDLALAHARAAALAVEARLLLEPALVAVASADPSGGGGGGGDAAARVKDVVFLDQALDLAARTALEGGVHHARRAAKEAAVAAANANANDADDDPLSWLLDVVGPAVENAALSSAPPGHLSDAAAAALHSAAEAASLAEWRAAAPMGEGGGGGSGATGGGDDDPHHPPHHPYHHPHHAKNELALCLRHLHAIRRLPRSSTASNARALHAVAALERARRVVADGGAALYAWLQPTAEALGRSALPQVPEQVVAMFGEECVRGTAASCLAQILAVAEPLARALAGERSGWQVISRAPGAVVAGRLARAACLADVQHASYAHPTVLVVSSPVRGEEDVPRGVVAVLVVVAAEEQQGAAPGSSSSSSWGGLDVLCHAAIRARNSGALLACCLDEDVAAKTLAAIDAAAAAAVAGSSDISFAVEPFVAVELASDDEVRVRAATEAEVESSSSSSGGGGQSPPALAAPPPPPPSDEAAAATPPPPRDRLSLLAAHDFAPGLVGAKALNTAALSGSRDLPPWVALPPWSLALPAGAFEAALADPPENAPLAEAVRELSAAADAALEAGDAEAAASALALARGAVLRMRAPEALARAFSAAVAEASWEEHVQRRERRRRAALAAAAAAASPSARLAATQTGDETDEGLLAGAGAAAFSPLSQQPSVASWAATAGDAAWSSAWPAVRRVWASQFNLRARVALRNASLASEGAISPGSLRMAVLLQPLLPASRAFVAHTRSPLGGAAGGGGGGGGGGDGGGGADKKEHDVKKDHDDDDDDEEVYVEAVQGLGETLVGAHPGRALGGVVRRSALRAPAASGGGLLRGGTRPPPAPSSPAELARAVRVLSVPSKSIVLRAPGLLAAKATAGSSDDDDHDHEDDERAGQLALAAAARLIARSDSNCEDLSGFAGAGLFDSHPSRPAVAALADPAADPLLFPASGGEDGCGNGGGGGDDDDDGLHAARILLWDLAAASLAVEDVLAAGTAAGAAAAQDVEGAVVGAGGASGNGGRVYVVQARPQV